MPPYIPLIPRSLGAYLTNLNVLLLGTCQLEPLLSSASMRGHKVNHQLLGSFLHTGVPKLDLTGVDTAVVALTLRQLLRDSFGKPNSLEMDTCLARIRTAEDANAILEKCLPMLEKMLETLHNVLKGIPTFLMAFIEPSFHYSGNLLDRFLPNSPKFVIQRLNYQLSMLTQRMSNFHFLDTNEVLNFVGRMHLQDDAICATTHASVLGGFDFANDADRLIPPKSIDVNYEATTYKLLFGEALWNLVADNVRVIRQQNQVKLIIVDLDDTLWRGVAADDTLPNHKRVEGWPLGFIESLLYFKGRGGLLAICSKNDRISTLKRFQAIWQGAIRESDFFSIKIDWEPKSRNVASILTEANLLPESAIFIDDNPREIDEVKSRFPMMRCLGGDHMDWRRIILHAPEMQVVAITDESANRTSLVRARVERDEASKHTSRDEWLVSLNLEAEYFIMRSSRSKYFERGFELLNKTNQFNTTGKRWGIEDIEQFFKDGGTMVLSSLKDKTVDNGIVGLALVRNGEILQVVLSCRVFNLGAEIGLGRLATEYALKRSNTVRATILDTGKNFSCHGYFRDLGFVQCDDYFEAHAPNSSPTWIRERVVYDESDNPV